MRMVSWEEGQGLLRGSLTVLRRRCGSPGCHCARGELHETPVLSYKQGGKTKMLSLTAGDVAGVSAALARYREAEQTLQEQAEAGREALRAHLEAARDKRGAR
jgi:hypothetical protein